MDLRVPQGEKRGHAEEEERGTFWRGTLIDSDTRLRVGRAIGKDEEDAVYNMTRTVKTLALEVNDGIRRWRPRTPAMAAGLTDHRWTVKEILTNVVVPRRTTNT